MGLAREEGNVSKQEYTGELVWANACLDAMG